MDTFIEDKVKLFYDDNWELVEWIVIKNPLEDVPANKSKFRPNDSLFHISHWDVRDYRVGTFLKVDIWDVIVKRKTGGREIIEVRYQWQWLTDINLMKISYVFLSV